MALSFRRELSLWFLIGLAVAMLTCPTGANADEFRAFWVDGWGAGFQNQTQVNNLLGEVGNGASKGQIRDANCNAVVIQVRRRADVCFPSAMGEPYFSGLSPSNFNATQAVINAAHDTTGGKKRIEVHAWMVTFLAGTGTVYGAHNNAGDPDNYWVTLDDTGAEAGDGGFDPSHPKCLEYTVNVSMDLVQNFDIDGIHYDYIRYTGQRQGYNPTAIQRFHARYGGAGNPVYTDDNFEQFRRDSVTALVRQMYARIQAVKPQLKLSGSFVTWNPSPTSSTRLAFQGTRPYYEVYSDWDSWLQEGIVDMAVPMTYYNWASLPNDYTKWMNFEKDRKANRHMVVGPGIYLNSLSNAILELQKTRDMSPAGNYAQGFCGYSYRTPYISGSWAGFSPSLISSVTPTWADIPPMPWKVTPTKGHIGGQVTLAPSGAWADGCSGAQVSIAGPESRSMRCDGMGWYAFVDLTPGTYTVTASYPGYSSQNRPVTVQIGSVTGNMYVNDFQLSTDTAPVITNVRAENVTASSANIRWSTDIPATSQVDYGFTTSYGSTTTLDSTLVTSHTVALSGLASGHIYHYRVRSQSSGGTESVSADYTFTTSSDATPPVISNVQATNITGATARITWTTDDPATSQVQYGLTDAYGSSTTEDANYVTGHAVDLSGLAQSTPYHYRVKSTNGSGQTSYSGDYTFATTAQVADIIIDDADANCAFTGTWTIGTYAGGWPTTASSYHFLLTEASQTGTTTWTPGIATSGKYDVYTYYVQGTNRSAASPFSVTHSNGTSSYTINQQAHGSQWYQFATGLEFKLGTTGYIRLHNGTGEASKVVMADAIKLVYTGPETTPPTVPTGLSAAAGSTSQINLMWNVSTDNIGVAGYKVYRAGVYAGSSATTSYPDIGLAANTQYAYKVSAYDAAGNESGQSSQVSRYTLSVAPTNSTVTTTRATGTWYNTPSFTFTCDGFGAGKVAYYRYVWDQSATHSWGGSETQWTSGSLTPSASSSPSGWYLHVRGYNGDGVANGSLDKGPYYYDGESPTMNTVTVPWYVAIRGAGYDDLTANWTASDLVSGIAEYQYAIGTTAGGTDILNWTSAGTNLSSAYHLPTAPLLGAAYYWTIKGRDQAGNWGIDLDSSASIYANAYLTLAEAMNNPDTTPVYIDQNKILSGAFATYYYVQEANRTRGLRVDGATSWIPGDVIHVAGRLATSGGERYLASAEASKLSGGTEPKPLGVGIQAIGGAAPDAFTQGLSTGCYNLGLLVRTAGRVSTKSSGWFMIGDGSGATAKVYSTVVPADNAFVGVTGVASVESGQRVIRTRSSSDVRTY